MPGRAEMAPTRGRRALLDLWVVVLVATLCAPMLLHGGAGLARDLVFVPHTALGLDDVGLGSSLPRAVPLDAVLGLLGTVVDGAVLFRVAVLGILLLAGFGAHRMLTGASVAGRLLLAGVAVWNPYVVERLALGQWALLSSYAAIWWLVPAVRTCVLQAGRQTWSGLVLWVALASLTPTGGVIALVVVICVGVATARTARTWGAVGFGLAFQLTWLLPGLLGAGSGLSDPRGVSAFSARAERPGGVVLSLVPGGGIWDRHVVPAALGGLPGQLLTALCILALVFGAPTARRRFPGLVPAAGVGFVLAVAGVMPGLDTALAWAAAHVPGGGLLRDGQKWLAPYVVLLLVSAAETLARVEGWLRTRDRDLARVATVTLAVLPVLLVIDAPGRTWEALTPVRYPADLRAAMRVLDRADPASGGVVTLPWASYRRYAWGLPVSASDPAVRWSARPVVVSDRLRVAGVTLACEDPRACAVGRIVTDGRPVADRLAAAGVGWVLVYRDQPGAATLPFTGLRLSVHGPQVALYSVPGTVVRPPRVGAVARVTVLGVDALLLGCVGVAGCFLLPRRRRTVPAAPSLSA